jgi:putative mRNA 3-end processing factor
MSPPLLRFTNKGIYCPDGDFYIDPWKPVHKALITHAHGDHARPGSQTYLAHKDTCALIKTRLGETSLETIGFNESRKINNIAVSFHPAGHVAGSAQIRLERAGEVWVFTGDFKLGDDPVAKAFEPIRCHTLITESTFGLPIYNWDDSGIIAADINKWCAANKDAGLNSVLFGYSLGKAQRLSEYIDRSIAEVIAHGAIYNIHQTLIECGYDLKPVTRYEPNRKYKDVIILMPPSAAGATWMKKFEPYRSADASGWMALRGIRRRKAVDKGFALSDHADWPSLLKTVKDTGAEKIYVTHGYTSQFASYLKEMGYDAEEVKTEYGDEALAAE